LVQGYIDRIEAYDKKGPALNAIIMINPNALAAADGFKIRFHFCPNCGSNVFWEGDKDPNIYGITVGSFADPNFPPPTFSVWEEMMHPWLGVATVTEHFPQGWPLTR
jgi:hypothetical protein